MDLHNPLQRERGEGLRVLCQAGKQKSEHLCKAVPCGGIKPIVHAMEDYPVYKERKGALTPATVWLDLGDNAE